ncbi:MAG: DEAD/DEAH box helicase family protein [Anaerolineae bacterium]
MNPNEAAFESAICDWLITHGGYQAIKVGNAAGAGGDFDPVRGLDTAELFAFLGATQIDHWNELLKRLGDDPNAAQARFADRLATEIDKRGTVDVLRHGVVDHGITLRLAYFKPAHGLTPELVRRYHANRLTVTRQLPYDPKSGRALDVALFINGLPVATAELKNPLTGQRIGHAMEQYRVDRDPANRTLGKRAVVHFAVDPEAAAMTTRLEGRDTRFLPFNQGFHEGAGNPPNPNGHRTAYVWERVWRRDAWLDLFARFIHVEKDSRGTKAAGKIIFPRFHQWDAVLRIESAAREEGPGHKYLVQHSAGSGKSNTIAWLAHRLSNLHDDRDRKVFDKVIVITDRVVLDRQLQDTIYQFEHAHGVVERIDKHSQQLADALAGEQARIVITTLQKFPYVLEKVGALPARSYAVVIDEAHSSQTGEAAKELKRVLGAAVDDEGDLEPGSVEEALAESVAARGAQTNLSYFAYTATPKGKTLGLFGRRNPATGKDEAYHLYSMRQAIEEGFILDVLAHYTTYHSYFHLEKAVNGDPRYDSRAAQASIARFVTLHDANLDQKAEVIVEHFRQHVADQIGGRAKGMVVCSSREHAVRFALALRRFVNEHGYDLGVLVAFSGTVTDAGVPFTEAAMNGFPDTETAKRFDTDAFRLLVVAEKFQTGYDQPLLFAMYVDKSLTGLNAVQTLSRLNRTHPDKEGTFVLDFRNDAEDIRDAFKDYYTSTVAPPTDPNLLYDSRHALDEFGVLRPDEIARTVHLLLGVAGPSDHSRIHAALAPAVDRVNALVEEERDRFRDALQRFVRIYSFLSQIVSFCDVALERDYVFCRALAALVRREGGITVDVGANLELTHIRLAKQFEGSVALDDEGGEVVTLFPDGGMRHEPDPEPLSKIIERFNERFGTDWTPADLLMTDAVAEDLINDPQVQLQAAANDFEQFRVGFDKRYVSAVASRLDRNERVAGQLLDDAELRAAKEAEDLPKIYARARVARQRVCPIGELIGPDREDGFLEYKSTLRWDIRAESPKTGIPERAVVKTIAGFLNAPFGGNLLIGITDDGQVCGLEADYATFSKRGQRGDHDLFGQHLQNLLVSRLGDAAASLVLWEFHTVDGAEICRVSIEPADFPVYEGTGDDDRTFWWRYPTGTKAITDAGEASRIVRRRFGVGGAPPPVRGD